MFGSRRNLDSERAKRAMQRSMTEQQTPVEKRVRSDVELCAPLSVPASKVFTKRILE